MACVQGIWGGVGGGVVGGWRGLLVWVWGSWGGWVRRLGASGGWRCSAGGSRFPGGGWCDARGAVPLRPLLNPPPSAWCAAVLGSGRPSAGRWLLLAGGCLVGCSSFLRGWAGLVGGLSRWLCSGWVVLDLGGGLLFSLVVQVRPRGCWGCSVVAGSVGCVSVGGLFSCWPCRSRWVGRPGRSDSSSPPSFSPHCTRQTFPNPLIRWVNSHVKTLTD